MNTLHLFAGAGGGIIADMMLGHCPVGAVEIDEYCRKVLRARQDDGLLPQFPIFKDVKEFHGNEIGERVDMVCAGFPCQDISVSGKGVGIEGDRSGLFFELVRICRNLRPKYIFLENSPAIVCRGLDRVLEEISLLRYDAEWLCLRASDVGAWHQRNRWWCLCRDGEISDTEGKGRESSRTGRSISTIAEFADGCTVSDTSYEGDVRGEWCNTEGQQTAAVCGGKTFHEGWQWWQTEPKLGGMADGVASSLDGNLTTDGVPAISKVLHGMHSMTDGGDWEYVPRVSSDVNNRAARLRAIGNGQVPACAVAAQIILFARYGIDIKE